MSVFSTWAQNYYDQGLSVLPIHPEKKACFVKGWTEKFSRRFPTIEEQEKYIEQYADHDIGLACGKASGIIAIDFDYDTLPDKKQIEDLVIGALPLTPCIKKGEKGWTRFYKFDGEVKNASIDRLGTRLIDVLATGRLTVLPPSTHKAGMKYKWIGSKELLDCDDDDLPMITSRDIRQLEEIANIDNSIFVNIVNKKSRHDTIVGFILSYSDRAKDIEDLIQATLQKDIEANSKDPKGPYLTDNRYLKGKTSYEFTKDLCERVCEWKTRKRASHGITWDIGKYPSLHSDGKKQSTNYEDFKSFFEFNYPDTRYDKIRRTPYYKCERSQKWEPIDNIREVIESKAHDAGLSPTYVNRHLQRWLSRLEPRLTIDIPRWSGRDCVSEMASKLQVSNLSKKQVAELLKEWGANIFRRLFDQRGNQQNRMLILKGKQGIGKDSWIGHMFRGFGPYFSEIEVQDRKAENYGVIADLLVANIPEFDETRKVSLSTLKSLITSPGATFRSPYARKADYAPFYTSFVSSCNFDNILRDPTGNRRFLIFEVDSIKWDYSDIPIEQLVAQFHHLYQTDYKANPSAWMIVDLYLESETPDDMEDLFIEDVKALMLSKQTPLKRWFNWSDISHEITRLALSYRIGLRTAQSMIKKNGMKGKDAEGHYYGINARGLARSKMEFD